MDVPRYNIILHQTIDYSIALVDKHTFCDKMAASTFLFTLITSFASRAAFHTPNSSPVGFNNVTNNLSCMF